MSTEEEMQKEVQKVIEYIKYIVKNPPFKLENFMFHRTIDAYNFNLGNNNLTQLPPTDHTLIFTIELQRFYLSDKEAEKLKEELLKMKFAFPLSNYGYNQHIGLLWKLDDVIYREKEGNDYYDIRISEFLNIRFFAFISIAITFMVLREKVPEEELEQEEESYEIDDDLDI